MTACDTCGQEREDVEWLPDPYLREVYEEMVYAYWCPDCHHERWMER